MRNKLSEDLDVTALSPDLGSELRPGSRLSQHAFRLWAPTFGLCVVLAFPPVHAQVYKHDANDRLTEAIHPDGKTTRYQYDSAGNLLKTTRIGSARVTHPGNGNSYDLITCGKWSDCLAEARAQGGELVTVRNQQENDWLLTTFLPRATNKTWPFWLGFNDIAAEGNWVWSSGEPVVYSHWYPGEPNNGGGRENVAHTQANAEGTWNDIPDDAAYGVLQAVVEFNHAAWDARKQYLPTANPNPPWRYARRLASGDLQTFDEHRSTCPALPQAPPDAFACWMAAGDTGLPMVAINTTAAPFRALTVEVPTNALVLHPGEEGDSAVVQFTVPKTGRYGLIASFESIDVAPQGVAVRMTAGADTLVEQVLYAYRQAVGVSQSLDLQAGEVMSFEVGAGPNTYGYDSVALRVRITPLP